MTSSSNRAGQDRADDFVVLVDVSGVDEQTGTTGDRDYIEISSPRRGPDRL